MREAEHFENVVLGGEAGKYIAWELARAGRCTAVIERALVGGSCPNIACMLSKNVIRSAKVAELFCKEQGSFHLDRSRKRCAGGYTAYALQGYCG